MWHIFHSFFTQVFTFFSLIVFTFFFCFSLTVMAPVSTQWFGTCLQLRGTTNRTYHPQSYHAVIASHVDPTCPYSLSIWASSIFRRWTLFPETWKRGMSAAFGDLALAAIRYDIKKIAPLGHRPSLSFPLPLSAPLSASLSASLSPPPRPLSPRIIQSLVRFIFKNKELYLHQIHTPSNRTQCIHLSYMTYWTEMCC